LLQYVKQHAGIAFSLTGIGRFVNVNCLSESVVTCISKAITKNKTKLT